MPTVLERLKGQLDRARAKHGSDDPWVKSLEEQIRIAETAPESAQQTYVAGMRKSPSPATTGRLPHQVPHGPWMDEGSDQ
jgi:hypothetical protein